MHFLQWKALYFDSDFNDFFVTGPIDNKSALVKVMAWRRICDKSFLNQCWPRSTTSYDVISPKWVNRVASTIYPMKYAQGCVLFPCDWFTLICQDCTPGLLHWQRGSLTEIILQCLWSNPGGYQWKWPQPNHNKPKQSTNCLHTSCDELLVASYILPGNLSYNFNEITIYVVEYICYQWVHLLTEKTYVWYIRYGIACYSRGWALNLNALNIEDGMYA